ncbi:pyrroloquinoline quinone biosynthesis peptide chaperone PqqD [Nitrincola sp. MINF-07-Sa-05]|uniref:pyrroloquinoline quinone biosynthesis peptide chaperone PqqD n=1 Tax=Nitrincola salilacus TaxID=3400273 RepID=UPI0039184C86
MSASQTVDARAIDARAIRLNPMFRLQWEAAQDAWVLLYPEGMVKLNATAAAILNHVDGKRSLAGIVQALQNDYPQAEGLIDDVAAFMQEAHANNWVIYD